MSESRNLGIALAEAGISVFLMMMIFTEEGVQALISALDSNPSFVFGHFNYIFPHETSHITLSHVNNDLQLIANNIPVGAYAIKKSLILSRFDTTLKSHEDWDFLLRNVDLEDAVFLDQTIVNIDKADEGDGSMQNRRRAHFWLDYVGIYGRFLPYLPSRAP